MLLNISNFGAIGDGIKDDTTALQEAINFCSEKGHHLVFEENKTYKITSQLVLKECTYYGNGASIMKDKDFYNGGQSVEFAIKTDDFRNNDSKYNKINLYNLNFTSKGKGNSRSLLGLANVKDSVIYNCNFTAESEIGQTQILLDLYSSNKNITIEKCKFKDELDSLEGGVWIRNADNGANNNITSNITINNCVFNHRTDDEVLAIWGWNGIAKDVMISNCIFNNNKGNLVTVDSSNETIDFDETSDNNKYRCSTHFIMCGCSGTTKNVTFRDNKFYMNVFDESIVKMTHDEENCVIDNVLFTNNYFEINEQLNKTSYFGLFSAKSADNIRFKDNDIVFKNYDCYSTVFNNVNNVMFNNILGMTRGILFAGNKIAKNNTVKTALVGQIERNVELFEDNDVFIDEENTVNSNDIIIQFWKACSQTIRRNRFINKTEKAIKLFGSDKKEESIIRIDNNLFENCGYYLDNAADKLILKDNDLQSSIDVQQVVLQED